MAQYDRDLRGNSVGVEEHKHVVVSAKKSRVIRQVK